MTEWRSILCKDVDWRRAGVTGHTSSVLFKLCRPDATKYSDPGEWSEITLGELADMGVRAWRHPVGIGDVAVQAIKTIIDMAAEGAPVTKDAVVADAYIPTCERLEERVVEP
jgi:hypothetical protein